MPNRPFASPGARSPGARSADARSADAGAATLHDVARTAGVSIATASRALNGSARRVSDENRARVVAAAAKLDYAPHLSAQNIARGSMQTAALVVSDIEDPYFSSIAAGVVQQAESAGLIVTMAVTDRSPSRELEIVRILRGQRPRAIILAGSRSAEGTTDDALVNELNAYQMAGGRAVLIGQPGLPFPTLTIDNTGGARRLATALVAAGYRRFAIIGASAPLRTSAERVAGFVDGLRRSKPRIGRPVILAADFTRNGGYSAATDLIRRGLRNTTSNDIELVFAVNDVMAIGAMTAFRDAGLTPGRDIAVAGFDDIAAAIDVDPGLTSVSVPLGLLGTKAMELAIADDTDLDPVEVCTEVVLRDSTPPR